MTSQQGNILSLLPESFVVVKCPQESSPSIPQATSKKYSFFSVTITPEECSIIAPEIYVKEAFTEERMRDLAEVDKTWRCFKVEGPLDFGLVGILHAILDPLKSAEISVLAVGTFNTDYFLVKEEKLNGALLALRKAGFQVNE